MGAPGRTSLPDVALGESAVPESEVIEGQEETVSNLLKEVWMFDSTQKLLPKQIAVPNIGWHPVIDRMFRPMPYDAENMPSWQRSMPRSYGIPRRRQM